jgi:hypothetical protein
MPKILAYIEATTKLQYPVNGGRCDVFSQAEIAAWIISTKISA